MSRCDVAIIGSGIGGLACATILSKEGLNVHVLEQNSQAGGSLRSFMRKGRLIDTGIHYVGSLRKGQVMHQYLKYFGILPDVRIQLLDPDGFDHIHLGGKVFRHASGFEHFEETLAADFPNERQGIHEYCNLLQHIGKCISPEILRSGHLSITETASFGISAAETIDSLVSDPLLQGVLAGSIPLYAGKRDMSPLYHHAMINFSNIEGAACFASGTQHVADALTARIRANGGEVSTHARATKLRLDGSKISEVEINNGERIIETKWVISDIPPAATFQLLESTVGLRHTFLNRLSLLPNTYGIFSVHLLLKRNTIPYGGCNHYLYNTSDVWNCRKNFEGFNIPVVLMCSQPSINGKFTDTINLLVPMLWEQLIPWQNTRSGHRGEEYAVFKQQFTEAVLRFTERFIPSIRHNVEAVYTSSPLTYRDYNSAPEGSAYGLQKDFKRPLTSLIPIRSRIGNLLLTGQNINVHGMLGTTVSAAFTCGELLGNEYLAKKIGDA